MSAMLTNLPISLPDWMPSWLFLLLLLPVLLYVLAFLLMPFSVFGVKARIESLESQIDSLHEDLRMMAIRASGALPPASTQLDAYDDVPNFGRIKKSRSITPEPSPQPVLPPRYNAPVPTPVTPARERMSPSPSVQPRPQRRTEPRLD
jgi:hypothetical protein